MFSPGDEVECINDSDPPQQPPNVVVRGQKYTVIFSEVRPRIVQLFPGAYFITPVEYVFVAEVPSPKGVGHYAFRFRKVTRRDTDISEFERIADGTTVVALPEEEKV
jgi:hypothetical protein